MSYTLVHIAQVINADLTGNHDIRIGHLVIDSRKVYSPASSVFFALAGERRNGHLFIDDLYSKGVRSFVVSIPQAIENYPDAAFLLVNDTLKALQQLAAFHRSRFSCSVIGITGSNGKTVVKEWLYTLLSERFSVVRSPKSYNSQVGVPLSIWEMNEQHELGIFEAGISRKDEMHHLASIILPSTGVLTNIGEAHSEGFLDNEEKLKEKCELFRHCNTIIANERFRDRIQTLCPSASVITWGKQEDNALVINSITRNETNTVFDLAYQGRKFGFEIAFTDDASVENVITCSLTALSAGLDIPTLTRRISLLQAVNMRLELKRGLNDCMLINDSYSADLSSLKIALNFLDQQSHGQSKTVILSDFPQSGKDDHSLYSQILDSLQRHHVTRMIGIGPHITLAFSSGSISAELEMMFYPSTEEFIRNFHANDFRQETILVKGARSFGFEGIVRLFEQKLHETVLEINLNAVGNNLKKFQQRLAPSTRIMGMVKAFAYGSGGSEIARILQFHKVEYLGVAYADEGVELRRSGITMPVMVMNTEQSAFDVITDNNLEPVIYSFDILHSLTAYLDREGITTYPVHIEVETGMNRLGFAAGDINELCNKIRATPGIRIQSVFTHLAASEDQHEDAFTFHQASLFEQAAALIKNAAGYDFLRHIANSAAAVRHPSLQLDMVRLGIGLYGIESTHDRLGLETVASLRSTISQIRKLGKGDTVSYNRKGVINADTVIGTVRIGYADGYPRRLGNGIGYVLVRGTKAPVVGTVCMDMFMIDVTAVPGAKEGDEVLIFGKELPVQEVARLAGTIPYEIMTGISQRVKRVYFEE